MNQTNLFLSTISTNELVAELKTRLRDYVLDPEKLKKGDFCFFCGQLMRAYNKHLDKRLVNYMTLAVDWMAANRAKIFKPYDVLKGDHRATADFAKLHYWEVIEKEVSDGCWSITKKGFDFLNGRIQLPRIMTVYNWCNPNFRLAIPSDEMVHIDNLLPRWQENRLDYVMDYEQVSYSVVGKQKQLNLNQ